jgi:hypothetical protein
VGRGIRFRPPELVGLWRQGLTGTVGEDCRSNVGDWPPPRGVSRYPPWAQYAHRRQRPFREDLRAPPVSRLS